MIIIFPIFRCSFVVSSYTVYSSADGMASVWFSPIAQFVEFHLRTCNSSGAMIRLVSVARQSDSDGYDITLTNTESTIVRRKTGVSSSASTPGLLSCVRRSKFWIIWHESGVVRVGKNRLGTNGVVKLQDTSADTEVIAAVLVSTTGSVGEWQIASANGESAYGCHELTFCFCMRTCSAALVWNLIVELIWFFILLARKNCIM